MAVVIDRQEIDVDISEELEPYIDMFPKAKPRGIKLQSCSPFRDEKTPSFAVNLEDGTWIDSGAYDEDWRKGNFIKLLSFLMGVTYDEAKEYLWQKYRTIYTDMDNWELKISLAADEESYRVVTEDELKAVAFRNPYLSNRGITEKVQRAFKIGYDAKSQSVVFAWHDWKGNVINLKYRSIRDKRFWYLEDGQPIKHHIYGMHFVHKMNLKTVYVVESETDALYLWSHGIPAIALGSASLSKAQERLILMSPIENLVLAFDNDKAGIRCMGDVKKRLMGKVDLWLMKIPTNCKDVNDIPTDKLIEATGQVERLLPKFL
ncbi:toprim domain-containing protein [Bacillus altitudinis]|uniref:toprim domain-containing protein n=1 Tax=Bacillus altitudinis TaxID=293387 RepID=UPI00389A151B